MTYEKIIKLPDNKTTIGICVNLVVFAEYLPDNNGNYFRYDVSVWQREGKQRNQRWGSQLATEAEIKSAKLELWQKIKPV